MRWSRDAKCAEHPYLTAAQPEPAEHLVLAAGEQGANPAQARGHTKGTYLEIRPGRSPAPEHAIRDVFSHAAEAYLNKTIDVSNLLAR